MITLICGTNRPDSRSAVILTHYAKVLKTKGMDHQILLLHDLPIELFNVGMYDGDNMCDPLKAIQEQFIFDVEKFIIVSPEYNGGMSGVLKLFIDAISVREYPKNFKGKKYLLTGVSSGRAGNLRGLESLTGILNYLGGFVFPQKLPISNVETLILENELKDEDTITAIEQHINSFNNF